MRQVPATAGRRPGKGEGGSGVGVVYIDEVFLLNTVVDYFLLLSAGKLTGETLRRGRMILSALLGGLYGALVYLPGWGFLREPLCQVAWAFGMTLLAFGGSRRLLRVSLSFLAVASAFAGVALALQLFAGGGPVLELKTILLAGAVCYALVPLVFRRSFRHGGRELAPAELRLGERRCRITALVDTGNTLTDPHTGRPVMVCEGEKVADLFPRGACPTAAELRDPVRALERRRGETGWRLLPYRAVGVEHGLLLAVRTDGARVGEEDYGPILVALSPTPVSDGGGYCALIGA